MDKETLNVDIINKNFKAQLNAVGFKEADYHILYIPSLQISSYGDTFKEANDMLKESLNQFSEDIFALKKNEITAIFRDLGWRKNKFFSKRLSHLSDTTFEDIKEEFNIPEETEVSQFPVQV